MSDTCVVLLCDNAYFDKFQYTCSQLRTMGKYNGDICLVIGDDLQNSPKLTSQFMIDNKIHVKHFPDIEFDASFLKRAIEMTREPHWYRKLFQYHKLHLFNTYFKQWNYIFYIDCGI